MFRRRLAVTCAAIIAVVTPLTVTLVTGQASGSTAPEGAPPGHGGRPPMDPVPLANWTVLCGPPVLTTKMDPIVFPGIPAGPANPSHTHVFFGNLHMSRSGTTTPADLRANQESSCQGPIDPGSGPGSTDRIADGASYWVPALYSNMDMQPGDLMTPIGAHVYYRNGGVDPALVGNYPPDLEMIAGNSKATTPQLGTVEWSCSPGFVGSHPGITHLPGEYSRGALIPDSCPLLDEYGRPFQLKVTILFKNCLKVTPALPIGNDSALLSRPISGGGDDQDDYAVCPAGTRAIPRVEIVVRYQLSTAEGITNDGTNWDLTSLMLASDGMNGAGMHGVTAHADFMNGWKTADTRTLVTDCFAPPYPHSCGSSFGD